jgi:hypothetical protein
MRRKSNMSRGIKTFSAGVGLFALVAALVWANSAIAQNAMSDPVAGVDNIAPDAPENLIAEVDFAGPSVVLTWDPSPSEGVRTVPVGPDLTSAGPSIPVNDVVRYNIWRSELGGEPELIDEVPVAVGSYSYTYVDETVESGITYDYSVTAVDGGGNESEAADSGPIAVGPPPVVSITPEGDIAFGEVGPDSETTETVIVTNTSTNPDAVLGVEVSIEGDGFAIGLAADNESIILAMDDSFSFSVSFLAAEVGNYNLDYSGTLTIRTNDPENRETVIALSATIVGGMDAPEVVLNRSRFNFRNVLVGERGTKTLIVTNKGEADLEVSLAIAGDDAFSIDDEVPVPSGTDTSEVVMIHFEPSTTGNFRADITITSNDPRNPEVEVMVFGSGVTEPVCARVEVIVDPETEEEVNVVGFIDEDDDVDYGDFFLFADVFGFTEDDVEYNYKADLDCNGHINLDDFMKFADFFGYERDVSN